jgi:putative Mn2+ efflux pump MntP
MNWISILGIAVGMAMDTFAVAIAVSVKLRKASGRQLFRLSFHFGWFQFMMPVVGWFAGAALTGWLGTWDHWIAFGLLAFIGGKMVYESFTQFQEAERGAGGDPTRGVSLVLLSVATSIDALAVGFSFSLLKVTIWQPAVVIGAVTGLLTLLGMRIGSRLGARLGKRMELAGGLVLIGTGLKILLEHLLS